METRLVGGMAVPAFDRDIEAWLLRISKLPEDGQDVWRIGIRNDQRRIYRYICARGERQHFDALTFFDKAGFSALPVKFAQEIAVDYVFQYDPW